MKLQRLYMYILSTFGESWLANSHTSTEMAMKVRGTVGAPLDFEKVSDIV